MDLPSLIEIPLRLFVLLAGLLLPGSMLLRALRLPWSLAAAFVTSSAALYVTVLIFAWTGATISWATLAGALGAVALVGRFIPVRNPAIPQSSSFACFSQIGGWLPLYLVFWGIVGYRLMAQPLNGPDVYFRWSYLAEQMLRFGSLDFYPPRSGPDFVRYFWAESIPPGIASLYAWAYACGGSKSALWTSPVVALQLLCMHEVIWRLATRWGGEVAARWAVLLAAACPLLTWSFLIGQETGLTALSVAGLVWCLQHSREEEGTRWSVLAGIFAIAAASTREYGPIFAVAAMAASLTLRLPRRQTAILALVALPFALAWPLRVYLLTGNPVYSLSVGGLFPTNSVFTEWSKVFHQDSIKIFSHGADWLALARYAVVWALPGVIGLIAMLFLWVRQIRDTRLVAGFSALVVALWVLSVAHTAGGLFYSLRVLSPALALLVVVGGYSLGTLPQRRWINLLLVFSIGAALLESFPKTLVLPENPYRLAVRDWPKAGEGFRADVKISEWKLTTTIQALPDRGRGRILTDNAGLPRVLASSGIEVVPLWSPEVDWLFEPNLKQEVTASLWQKSGFAYLLIGKASPTANFMNTHAQWRTPYFTVTTVVEDDLLLVLHVTAVAPHDAH